jgi:rhodanese-related sulfurtransferase
MLSIKKVLRESMLLSVIAVLPAVALGMLHPRGPAWTPPVLREGEVLLRTARGWGGDVMWVDSRSAEQYLLDRIPGAMPLNEAMWSTLLPDILTAGKGKRMIVYCEDDACGSARSVADRLKRDGQIADVYVLKGGFAAWKAAMQ